VTVGVFGVPSGDTSINLGEGGKGDESGGVDPVKFVVESDKVSSFHVLTRGCGLTGQFDGEEESSVCLKGSPCDGDTEAWEDTLAEKFPVLCLVEGWELDWWAWGQELKAKGSWDTEGSKESPSGSERGVNELWRSGHELSDLEGERVRNEQILKGTVGYPQIVHGATYAPTELETGPNILMGNTAAEFPQEGELCPVDDGPIRDSVGIKE